jgi:hypothetical protein
MFRKTVVYFFGKLRSSRQLSPKKSLNTSETLIKTSKGFSHLLFQLLNKNLLQKTSSILQLFLMKTSTKSWTFSPSDTVSIPTYLFSASIVKLPQAKISFPLNPIHIAQLKPPKLYLTLC